MGGFRDLLSRQHRVSRVRTDLGHDRCHDRGDDAASLGKRERRQNHRRIQRRGLRFVLFVDADDGLLGFKPMPLRGATSRESQHRYMDDVCAVQ